MDGSITTSSKAQMMNPPQNFDLRIGNEKIPWHPRLFTRNKNWIIWAFLLLARFRRNPKDFLRRNPSPQLYSRNQRTVQTMHAQRLSATKEGKNGCISRKCYGNFIWWISWNYLGWLLRKGENKMARLMWICYNNFATKLKKNGLI